MCEHFRKIAKILNVAAMVCVTMRNVIARMDIAGKNVLKYIQPKVVSIADFGCFTENRKQTRIQLVVIVGKLIQNRVYAFVFLDFMGKGVNWVSEQRF